MTLRLRMADFIGLLVLGCIPCVVVAGDTDEVWVLLDDSSQYSTKFWPDSSDQLIFRFFRKVEAKVAVEPSSFSSSMEQLSISDTSDTSPFGTGLERSASSLENFGDCVLL